MMRTAILLGAIIISGALQTSTSEVMDGQTIMLIVVFAAMGAIADVRDVFRK